MCGLSAKYYSESASLLSSGNVTTLLTDSLANIEHRDPDYAGTWISTDSHVGIGHVRLSIIDLETGQIRAELEAQGSVFNTKSDSEVIIHLYKRDSFNLLSSLRGELAFVLFGSKRRLLFAAHDRFGIKPLYYTVSDGQLLIASEMKAFLPFGWKSEWDIKSLVQSGDFSDDRTVFRGIHKLMEGHFLLSRQTVYLKTQPYWDLNYAASDAPNNSTVEEMISTVRTQLFEAIRLHLSSDVPVGIHLSGGIDNDPNAKLATFTLAFPVRTTALVGADAHMVNITEVDMVNVEQTIWHVESVLSGEGAVEFFGGYAWLPVDYLCKPDPGGLALGLELPSDGECQEMLGRIQMATVPRFTTTARAVTGEPDVTRAIAEGLDPRVREKVISDEWHPLHVSSVCAMFCSKVGKLSDTPMPPQYISAKTILLQNILNHMGKRMDMAHSVEGRPPFLDHRVVEYISTLPPSLKVRPVKGESQAWSFTDKWILRQAVRPYLTDELYQRKNLGYNAPPSRRTDDDSALVPLQIYFQSRITRTVVENIGFFDWAFVQETLKAYLTNPKFPADGALDSGAAILVYVLSFIVIQERFSVVTWRP
ncbi:putative asparagine synthase [Mycena olivaceomarginata]|nr:putative asparagine synthase [Mycena olivaceomarginata]